MVEQPFTILWAGWYKLETYYFDLYQFVYYKYFRIPYSPESYTPQILLKLNEREKNLKLELTLCIFFKTEALSIIYSTTSLYTLDFFLVLYNQFQTYHYAKEYCYGTTQFIKRFILLGV